MNMTVFLDFVSVTIIYKHIQFYQFGDTLTSHYKTSQIILVTMKPIAIILLITSSCMAMKSVMAKYILVDLDQAKPGSKSLQDYVSTNKCLFYTPNSF